MIRANGTSPEYEVVKTFAGSKKKILCNIILDRLTVRDFGSENLNRVVGCVTLFLIIFLLTLGCASLALLPVKTALTNSIITASIASLSFYVISRNYQYIEQQVEKALGEQVGESVHSKHLTKDLDNQLASWVRKVVNPWSQLAGSIIAVILITLFCYVVIDSPKLTLAHFANYVAIVIVEFSMGQGAYWAFVSPLFTRELSREGVSGIEVDPLYPSRTPILIAASKFLSLAAVSDALMVTLCLISLFIVKPSFSENRIIYSVLVVLAGYVLTAWNFVYPQWNLAQIIQCAKKKTLSSIRLEANKMYSELEKLDSSDLERLEKIMNLYRTVSEGPNTMINLIALRSFIGAIFTPTIVGVAGLIDWKSLLKKLPM